MLVKPAVGSLSDLPGLARDLHGQLDTRFSRFSSVSGQDITKSTRFYLEAVSQGQSCLSVACKETVCWREAKIYRLKICAKVRSDLVAG